MKREPDPTTLSTQPMIQSQQQKRIGLTVLMLLIFIAVILALLVHKITTPRYLSAYELSINGLTLLSPPQPIVVGAVPTAAEWHLAVATEAQRHQVNNLLGSLRPPLRRQIGVWTFVGHEVSQNHTKNYPYDIDKNIGIALSDNTWVGYLTPPFAQNSMVLTLSSLLTHRQYQ